MKLIYTMKNKEHGNRFAATALAALGTLFMCACLALSAFDHLATDGDLYYRIQRAEQVDAGISEDEMRALDAMLGDYLAGDTAAFDAAEAFNAREKAHMADVLAIFQVLRRIKWCLLGASALALAGAHMAGAGRARRAWRAAASGAAVFFAPLIILAAISALDFSGAFVGMHRLLFDNDLWLLNPDTDLMIRMLPERFFVAIALYLAIGCALAALVAPFLSGAVLTLAARVAPLCRKRAAREG